MFASKSSAVGRSYLGRSFLQARKQSLPTPFVVGRTFLHPNALLIVNHTFLGSSSRSRTGPVPPRIFPSTGFEVIDSSVKIEEETLSFYDPRMFYPVRIGDVFRERYQVVAKLGWGAHSTIWLDNLCRALKVHINTLQHNSELQIYKHLNSPALEQSDHGGKEHLRELYEYFKIEGPHGTHDVFVLRPLGASIRDLQKIVPDHVFPHPVVPDILLQILPTIHFLHTEADITHTDIHTGNLLQGIKNEQLFAEMEEDELSRNLCPRKDAGDRTIYTSQIFQEVVGRLYLRDLGEALVGNENVGPAMPTQYRAPEAWDMMQPADLFKIYGPEDEFLNNAHHLAAMIALLGPPPRESLVRSQESLKYWDENGDWTNIVPIPTDRTFECLATMPDDEEERELFINFISALLWWMPEERLDSLQVFSHLWIYRALQKNRQPEDDRSSQGEDGPPPPSSG
ncbi:kinase-like protein [Diaporthe sp. PMI_573]|nr:kinase-like protein [Diaporthaceae sp. PMI_573]